jgi:transcriptional regulator with XRE-family HTH domain
MGDRAGSVGGLVRSWRNRRGLTQLEVSVETGVSTRHLSCVETGRARPSRELLLMLAEHLRVPLGERNRGLLAGGFSPEYPEVAVDAAELAPLRHQFRRLMAAHEPNPALLVDRRWNLVEANGAAALFAEGIADHLLDPPVNVLRLALHPEGLPRISTGSPWCLREVFQRLDDEAQATADPGLRSLVEELEGYLPSPSPAWATAAAPPPDGVLSTFEVKTRLGAVRLFTVMASLVAPVEVTSSGLALETFLPADEESARLLHELHRAERRPPA